MKYVKNVNLILLSINEIGSLALTNSYRIFVVLVSQKHGKKGLNF